MTYRKWGTTERWENGSRIVVSEHGIAEEGETFECFPGEPGEAPLLPARDLEMLANQVLAVVPGEVAVERLILTHGSANHECEGRRWSDQTFRMHVSLARASGAVSAHGTRARLDLASFDLALVETVAQALLRLEPEREAPPRLRLAPNVAAAVLPSLVGLVPPNVRLIQTAGGLDGKGLPIEEATSEWPNWYRPSYRVRPVRMPLNLRLECEVDVVDRSRPVAVALIAPVGELTFRLLVDDGNAAYPTTVRLTRIDAVSSERTWYPYAGGSFGAEMML